MRLAPAVACLIILVLGGCTKTKYSNPNATQGQFLEDRNECLEQAHEDYSKASSSASDANQNKNMLLDCRVWFSCMGALGYVVDNKNGNLVFPPGKVVPCAR